MDFVFSPLDRRYKDALPQILSEEDSFSFQIEVEACWLKTLRDEKICPPFDDIELDKILKKVSFQRVEEIEKRTQHATRALVEGIAEELDRNGKTELSRWVHVGLTSFDVVDTASRLRLKTYIQKDFFPLIDKTLEALKSLAAKHSQTLQAGRTHGQWAVPTYFGLSLAEAYSRLKDIKNNLEKNTHNLRGQSSGAIGGYHASSLICIDALQLEEKFLKKLNLKPDYGSTQILPPEDFAQVAQSIFLANSIITKVANDWRHLARSEIGELFESMGEGQVGSSTMPQKRNPWNLEHICSLFKVLKSRLQLIQDDVITEHQRDLTNSASGRFYFEFFAISHLLFSRFLKVASKIQVDEKQMKKNFDQAGSSIFAEALYVSLTLQGQDKAHDIVREASRKSEKTGKDLLTILREDKKIPSDLSHESLMKKILEGSRLKLEKILKDS